MKLAGSDRNIVVLDIGKTHAKVLLFDTLASKELLIFQRENLIINEPPVPWENSQINTLYWSLVINGMIATTFAIFVMIWAQKILSAGETAVIFSLEPIFAALFSIFIPKLTYVLT